jgi:hypothetical protein
MQRRALCVNFLFVQATVMLIMLFGGTARAQSETALAETLFVDGKALLKAGRYREACAKLTESQRLDPGSGTLLALATCHELEGKTATAWAEYSETVALATRAGRTDRVDAARAKVATLQKNVPYLVLKISPSFEALPGSNIVLGGKPLSHVAWSTKIPVDPGAIVLEVSAKDKESWTRTVFAIDGNTLELVIPELVGKPRTEHSGLPDPVDETAQSKASTKALMFADSPPRIDVRKPIGWGGIVLGSLALVGGGVFGTAALIAAKDVRDACPDRTCTSQREVETNQHAGKLADISTVLIPVGLVFAGIGTFLLVSAKASEPGKRSSIAAWSFASHGVSW